MKSSLDVYREEFAKFMTLEKAEFLKEYWVNQNYSWRACARKYAKQFPSDKIESGHQIEGMVL